MDVNSTPAKRRSFRGLRTAVASLALVLMLSVTAFAAALSTVALDLGVAGAAAVTGSVALGGVETLAAGHTVEIDGGTAQALTIAGDGSFSVSVAALADGYHSIKVNAVIDLDGAGVETATETITVTSNYNVASGLLTEIFLLGFDITEVWPATQMIWDALKPVVYLAVGVGLAFMIIRQVRSIF